MGKFNLRVYGLCIDELNKKILVSEEMIGENLIVKFPGGGLEFGEGITDCLKREWMEELNVAINIKHHFYTTEFFQKSAWDGSQVISIYYLVSLKDQINFPFSNGRETNYYVDIKQLDQIVKLPIDLVVAKRIANIYS